MKTVLESGLVLPEPYIEQQLRRDTLNAFNILIWKGKLHPESCFDFQRDPRNADRPLVRIWVPDPEDRTESMVPVVFADPRDLIVAAGTLAQVRGEREW